MFKKKKQVLRCAQDDSCGMGISEYQLSKILPKKLEAVLPTIDEIEAELN